MGDPHGIGPEVLLKSLSTRPGLAATVFGSESYLRSLAEMGTLSLDWDSISIRDLGDYPFPPRWGVVDENAGKLAYASLREALGHCRQNGSRLLVTAPVSKQALQLAGFEFPGQTEFIASGFPDCNSAMTFFSDQIRVVLATAHVPLCTVCSQLTVDLLFAKGDLFYHALRRIGCARPRIAVCGLNPHASEAGILGSEEAEVVIPALELLRAQYGRDSFQGPFPADTVFRLHPQMDGFFAMYHDQGLIPVKLIAFHTAANVTLGLPLVRTSPDHGTAFDIAGRGVADPGSMNAAIDWGMKLAFEAA